MRYDDVCGGAQCRTFCMPGFLCKTETPAANANFRNRVSVTTFSYGHRTELRRHRWRGDVDVGRRWRKFGWCFYSLYIFFLFPRFYAVFVLCSAASAYFSCYFALQERLKIAHFKRGTRFGTTFAWCICPTKKFSQAKSITRERWAISRYMFIFIFYPRDTQLRIMLRDGFGNDLPGIYITILCCWNFAAFAWDERNMCCWRSLCAWKIRMNAWALSGFTFNGVALRQYYSALSRIACVVLFCARLVACGWWMYELDRSCEMCVLFFSYSRHGTRHHKQSLPAPVIQVGNTIQKYVHTKWMGSPPNATHHRPYHSQNPMNQHFETSTRIHCELDVPTPTI